MLEGTCGKLLGGGSKILVRPIVKHYYFQVSDEECEDIPSERCEAVNVKVARRKCGEQEQSSYGH